MRNKKLFDLNAEPAKSFIKRCHRKTGISIPFVVKLLDNQYSHERANLVPLKGDQIFRLINLL